MPKPKKPLFARIERPRNVRAVIPILKVRATDRTLFICCSVRPWGFPTHWDQQRKRTQPCIAHRAECQGCVQMYPRRDRGYILIADRFGAQKGFLDLTPMAFDQLAAMADVQGSIRGKWFIVEREGQRQRGALLVSQAGMHPELPSVIPEDQDPEPSLRRIWGLDVA